MDEKAATQEKAEAQASTWVIWDIKSCPVPAGCSGGRASPCIKGALKNLGYSGPVTITAIGHLLDFPKQILRWVAYSGIILYHIPLDVVNILEAMLEWSYHNQPPGNILLISSRAKDFSDGLEYLHSKGFNILQDLHQIHDWEHFLTDTMDAKKTCSKPSESVWLCRVCRDAASNDLAGKGFESIIEHLRSQNHRERMLEWLPPTFRLRRDVDEEKVGTSFCSTCIMLNNKKVSKAPTDEEASARTWVLWDMKSCHVPSEYAARVGPSIKRVLEKSGYSGSLTITAIGHLIDFPEDVLRSLLSTGISLHHIPLDAGNVGAAIFKWGTFIQPPANILLISAREFSINLKHLQSKGFNILRQILYDDSLGAFPPTTEMKNLWKNFVTDTMDSEEKCSETSESGWLCGVCRDDDYNGLAGNGYENLSNHLWSPEHRKRMLGWLRCTYILKREENTAEVQAARMKFWVSKDRKRKNPG